MTVTNTDNKMIYTGDGGTLVFPYTFKIFEDGDLEVKTVLIATGAETVLTLTTDYTVSGAGNPSGGNVTLLITAPDNTYNIVITRILPITQQIDYIEADTFPAESHEEGLDRGTMVDQQLQEQIDRAIQLASNITGIDITLPPPEAYAILGWDSAGTALTNYAGTDYRVGVDDDAVPGTLGAAGNDGVLRVSGLLTYTDGGDYVTIGITNAAIDHDQLTNFTASEHFTMLDEDDMASDSDTQAATQQSIKAYVDAQIVSQNEFTELTDTPANYVGAGGYLVRVNVGADALVFGAEGDIDHDGLTNFDANEHVDHTSVSISAGTGLTGGGTIAANRTISLSHLGIQNLVDPNADRIMFWDDSSGYVDWLVPNTGLGIIGTNLNVTADYSVISGNDGNTDVSGAELETLTDGSNADGLHVHTATGVPISLDDAYNSGNSITVDGSAVTLNSSILNALLLNSTNNGSHIRFTGDPTVASPVDGDLWYNGTNLYFYDGATTTDLLAGGGGSSAVRNTFTNASLVAGVLTISHSLGLSAPYTLLIQIYDNNGDMIVPDDITGSANSHDINLSTYGTITGTWGYIYIS